MDNIELWLFHAALVLPYYQASLTKLIEPPCRPPLIMLALGNQWFSYPPIPQTNNPKNCFLSSIFQIFPFPYINSVVSPNQFLLLTRPQTLNFPPPLNPPFSKS